MNKRPMLILNGETRRYDEIYVALYSNKWGTTDGLLHVALDGERLNNETVSFSHRPSGRCVIWVSTEGE